MTKATVIGGGSKVFNNARVYAELHRLELVHDSDTNLERANLARTLLFVCVALMI